MKKWIPFFTAVTLHAYSFAQGCIPVRNVASFGQCKLIENANSSDWQLSITSRYFKSFRDFREKTDLKTPPENESVNHVFTTEFSLGKLFKNGWSATLDIPISANARTSSFEHGGANTTRHTTSAFGLSDIRFTAYKWLLPAPTHKKWNMQLGLGLKFPTGNYNCQDYFYRNDTTKILSAINPSVQLGDGGTGIIAALNTFLIFNNRLNVYSEFYYLANPQEQSGTLYTMGKVPSPNLLKADAVNMSIPDVFSIRAGINANLGKLSLSAGTRYEGTPVYDLIGGSNGARRAGYYLSVEPGVLYKMKKAALFAYVPVVVSRSIRQNVPDKKLTEITGTRVVGPGGSANYMVLAGISVKL